MDSSPADTDSVIAAIRLGWSVAEVRGRSRPGDHAPIPLQLPGHSFQLPLRAERSRDALRAEAQAVLLSMADTLMKHEGKTRAEQITREADSVASSTPGSAGWDSLARRIFDFDEYTQNTLTSTSEMQACGYQLGRGLAESYWALDSGRPADDHSADDHSADEHSGATSESWTFLLGGERCLELSRLAGRLSGYFNPYTPTGLAGTLAAWQEVAATPDWRSTPEAKDALYAQSRRWYELVVLRQDPSSLIKPYAVARNLRAVAHGFRSFWPQLVATVASLAAIAWFLSVLGNSDHSDLVKSVLGVLSAVGISGAGISAYLKNTAQSLTTRIKEDAFADLVAAQLTIAPPRYGGMAKDQKAAERRRDRVVSHAVRRRDITTVTPPPP